jgi:hypothetical protein
MRAGRGGIRRRRSTICFGVPGVLRRHGSFAVHHPVGRFAAFVGDTDGRRGTQFLDRRSLRMYGLYVPKSQGHDKYHSSFAQRQPRSCSRLGWKLQLAGRGSDVDNKSRLASLVLPAASGIQASPSPCQHSGRRHEELPASGFRVPSISRSRPCALCRAMGARAALARVAALAGAAAVVAQTANASSPKIPDRVVPPLRLQPDRQRQRDLPRVRGEDRGSNRPCCRCRVLCRPRKDRLNAKRPMHEPHGPQ